MEVVLATQNKDKIKEIKEILSDLFLKIYSLDDFANFPSIVEDGKTFEENAIKKAKTILKFSGKPSLADDSGLEVEKLGGLPGVYSSRFAGEKVSYLENNKKLLNLLKGVPFPERKACFRCVIALALSDEKIFVSEGKLEGYILEEMRGENGFGYDPLFYLPTLGKTLAEISPSEKNKISHRALALRKMKEIIASL